MLCSKYLLNMFSVLEENGWKSKIERNENSHSIMNEIQARSKCYSFKSSWLMIWTSGLGMESFQSIECEVNLELL